MKPTQPQLNAIRALIGNIPDAEIAQRVGVSLYLVLRMKREWGPQPTKPYLCEGCEKMVTLRPCVVCAALRRQEAMRA